jgi:hypothetical protein
MVVDAKLGHTLARAIMPEVARDLDHSKNMTKPTDKLVRPMLSLFFCLVDS